MGVPLYALVLVFTWLVVRAVYPSAPRAPESPAAVRDLVAGFAEALRA